MLLHSEEWPGTVILVSHDRALLDGVCSQLVVFPAREQRGKLVRCSVHMRCVCVCLSLSLNLSTRLSLGAHILGRVWLAVWPTLAPKHRKQETVENGGERGNQGLIESSERRPIDVLS